MSTLRERFEMGCSAKGLSAVQMADKIGISKQFISDIVSAKTPGRKHIAGIAQVLDCGVEWLINGTGEPPTWAGGVKPSTMAATIQIDLKSPREVPVIAYAGAADGGQRGQLLSQPEPHRLSSDIALIAVRGGSAYPAIYDGQYAMVNLKKKVNNNNLVAVVLADSDEVLLKRWCQQKNKDLVVLASPDGGRDSLVVHLHDIRQAWPVVGVLYE